METVHKYSLDALLSSADSADIIKDVRKDLQSALVSVDIVMVERESCIYGCEIVWSTRNTA